MSKHNTTETVIDPENKLYGFFSGGCQRGGGEGRRAIGNGD